MVEVAPSHTLFLTSKLLSLVFCKLNAFYGAVYCFLTKQLTCETENFLPRIDPSVAVGYDYETINDLCSIQYPVLSKVLPNSPV